MQWAICVACVSIWRAASPCLPSPPLLLGREECCRHLRRRHHLSGMEGGWEMVSDVRSGLWMSH